MSDDGGDDKDNDADDNNTSGVRIVLIPSRSLKSKSRTGNGPPSLVHLIILKCWG